MMNGCYQGLSLEMLEPVFLIDTASFLPCPGPTPPAETATPTILGRTPATSLTLVWPLVFATVRTACGQILTS